MFSTGRALLVALLAVVARHELRIWPLCAAFRPTTTTSRRRLMLLRDGRLMRLRNADRRGWIMSTARAASIVNDDEESTSLTACTSYQTKDLQTRSFRRDDRWARARELACIVSTNIVGPLLRGVVGGALQQKDGMSSFWAWKGRNDDDVSIAEHIRVGLEKMGPTFVKFGQAVSTRPDMVTDALANELSILQDRMAPFDSHIARNIIRQDLQHAMAPDELERFLDSFSPADEPVAAASIGQVYKGYLDGYGAVAIKVKRPGIDEVIARDADLLRSVAGCIERLPGFVWSRGGAASRLVRANVVDGVNEFMSRMFEEVDFRNEVQNAKLFASLYSLEHGSSDKVRVVVPNVLEKLCSDRVIVMEWIDGTKLADVDQNDPRSLQENLDLIEQGIECTLSQLLDVGVLHADPHSGNMMKVRTEDGVAHLGYLDFGIVSTVDERVRDGLVCAIVELVFQRDVEAVADLFGELQLLPQWVLDDPIEKAALVNALDKSFLDILTYPPCAQHTRVQIPQMRFDNLLSTMAALVGRFEFSLPPYFLNNARALATLEGLAKQLDPSFNVLTVAYPYALNRLLNNPSTSPVVEATMLGLFRSPATGLVEAQRIKDVLAESARLTSSSRARIFFDVSFSSGGRRIAPTVSKELLQTQKLRAESRKRSRPIPKQRIFRL